MSEYSQEAINKVDAYLEHHGILGQKWGVRHGPPYPLSEGQKSKKEKKVIGEWLYKKREENRKKENLEEEKAKEKAPVNDVIENYVDKIAESSLRNYFAPGENEDLDEFREAKYRDSYEKWMGQAFENIENFVKEFKSTYGEEASEDLIKRELLPKILYETRWFFDENGDYYWETRDNLKKDIKERINKLLHSDSDDYISHHGILGQKWGVKHGPPYPLDSKTSKKVSGGKVTINVKDLSDEDLKKIVQRLNMEKQLKDLTKEQKSKGKKFGDKVMDKLGDTALEIIFGTTKTIGTAVLTQKLGEAINEKYGGLDVIKIAKKKEDK